MGKKQNSKCKMLFGLIVGVGMSNLFIEIMRTNLELGSLPFFHKPVE